MNSDSNNPNLTAETTPNIRFEEVFNLEEIQHLQDLFSEASGVASIITHPDGTPITKPSNFSRLCKDIIRKTDKGLSNCYQSDSMLGRYSPAGAIVWPCLSAGLWDAGASITVGGTHIANWLIGQVRNDTLDEQKMIHYADEIGVDREEFFKALLEVPVMTLEQFNNVAKMVFAFAKELSEKGYNNLLLRNQILERDKAINLLQESERKYNSMYESVHEVFFKTDLNGNILEISPSIKYFTEFNKNDFIGTSVYDLYDNPNDRENLLNAIKKYGEVSDYELKFRTKTGLIRYASMNARLILDENGIPNYLVGAIRDITESKKSREARVKLEKAIQTSGEAIFLTDSEGIFTFINPAFTLLYGYTSDEIIGKATPRIINSRVIGNSVFEQFWKTLLNGEEVKGELINRKKDDTLVHIDASATPIFDETNNIIGFLGIQRDITERKKAEDLLIESEESYRSLFENMLNGFAFCHMIYDNDNPYDFVYLKVNKSFESLTGLKDVEGKKVSDIIPEIQKSDQALIELYGRVAMTGIPEFFETYVISLDDWYSISVYSPKKDYFIAVFDVITERKKNEQELISAKEKAEESDRLKTAFLNNISHEIRTPFNGILGFLSILQDDELPREERDEYIGIINQSAERLMNTINEIVEISQIQAGKTEVTLAETNIDLLTGELNDRFKKDANTQGLEFIINNELPSGMGSFSTDSTKLNTILSNLISNALKFTKTGSVILQICKNNDYLEFSVKDTGIGIPENQKLAIFERFIQVDISRTRQFEGLGLGLSITKFYIEMLGGTIWLESEENKGSTFHFTLPFNGR